MVLRYSGRIMGVVSGASHLIKGREVNQQSEKRARESFKLGPRAYYIQCAHLFVKVVVTVVNGELFYRIRTDALVVLPLRILSFV